MALNLNDSELQLLRLIIREATWEALDKYQEEHKKVHEELEKRVKELEKFMWKAAAVGATLLILLEVAKILLTK
jgi:DNA-binding ferritin-like protein (Dps family)